MVSHVALPTSAQPIASMSTIGGRDFESASNPEHHEVQSHELTSGATFETIDGNDAILDRVCDSGS